MAIRKTQTIIAVLGLAIASGLAWWVQNRPSASESARMAGGEVGATAGGPGGAASGARGGPGGNGPVTVEVGRVEVTTLLDAETAVGSLRSRQGVMLRPEVAGRIATIGFRDGQRVRRGQLLVQLDDTLQRAQLKQAQAQAGIARTNLARNRELLAANFISQSAVDQSAAALEVAEAQVALARAQLARMRVVAPFDGVAGIGVVDLGDYVKDGADLVGIEDTSSMWVDFRLPERVMARLQNGQAVEVSFDAMPGRVLRGRVEAADAEVDANGRSLLVRARIDNPNGTLRSGMFARVRTVFGQREGATVVPEEALVPQGNKQFVFKLVDAPTGGKVSQRLEARVGTRLPGKAEILEGLKAGDLVVTAGHARLLRGDALPVKIVEVGRGGAGPQAPGANGAPGGAASGARPGAGNGAAPA